MPILVDQADAAAVAVAKDIIDWDFVKQKPRQLDVLAGQDNNVAPTDDEDGDHRTGYVENRYHGALPLLRKQFDIWPKVGELNLSMRFDVGELPQDELLQDELRKLNFDHLGLVDYDISEIFHDDLARLRMWGPAAMWDWLFDLVAFHPARSVVSSAQSALQRMLATSSGSTACEPLSFKHICRALAPLSLLSTTHSQFSASAGILEGPWCAVATGVLEHGDRVPSMEFPAHNLKAVLDICFACLQRDRHSLSARECLSLLLATLVISADSSAQTAMGIGASRRRLQQCLLDLLPVSEIWPGVALHQVLSLIRQFPNAETQRLILQ